MEPSDKQAPNSIGERAQPPALWWQPLLEIPADNDVAAVTSPPPPLSAA